MNDILRKLNDAQLELVTKTIQNRNFYEILYFYCKKGAKLANVRATRHYAFYKTCKRILGITEKVCQHVLQATNLSLNEVYTKEQYDLHCKQYDYLDIVKKPRKQLFLSKDDQKIVGDKLEKITSKRKPKKVCNNEKASKEFLTFVIGTDHNRITY